MKWEIRLMGHPPLQVETDVNLDESFDRHMKLKRRPKLFRPCPGVAIISQMVLGVQRLPDPEPPKDPKARRPKLVIRGFTGGE